MHCVGTCVSRWNLIPVQGKSAPDCLTKAGVTGQRSDVMDRALMWGEAENIRRLNQSLCLFNWPSFPSLVISLPPLYSVCVIYMESRAKWTHGRLHWRWKRTDGLAHFWPPRTLSLDMTDLKDSKDLREQLQYGCANEKKQKKAEIPLHFKESYAIPDWVSLFCHFPLLSLTIWPVVSFCLRRFGSSGSSHFACYELSVLLLFFPLLSQSLPPNLFFLNMTLLFCEVPTSFSLCFTASPLRWGAVWRSLMSSKGCRLTPADSLSSSAHGSCLPLFYSLRPSSGSST